MTAGLVVYRNRTYLSPTTTRVGGGGGGGGGGGRVRFGRVQLQWSGGGWPSLRLSTFRPRAAVEEGFVRENAGSFYDLLGVPASGSTSAIKKAYKQLARKYHPDVSPPERAAEYTRRFIEVHEAYETLSDPGRRAIYDRDLTRSLPLAFSASRCRFDEEPEERSGWRNHWQDQLTELKRRSMNGSSKDNLSWGAQMRRRRAESSREEVA
ncbi:unnamed protein product [Musa banksii]